MQTQPFLALVCRDAKQLEKLRPLVSLSSCQLVLEAKSGTEALRSLPERSVDIVIADYELGDMTGLVLCESLAQTTNISMILLVDPQNMDYVRQMVEGKDVLCIQKPWDRIEILQTLQTMVHYRVRLSQMHMELRKLRTDMNRRALADKAKALLMKKTNLSEAEAWRFIQKTSMDKGMPLDKVAEAIIKKFA